MLTDRTRLHRKPSRGSHDAEVIHAILDEGLVCHVGFVADGAPVVIPTAAVRVADRLYLHGSAANGMLRAIDGTRVCVTVTLLDALVLGRTAFHHSVNYRSVVMFGRATRVDDPDEKRTALAALIEKMEPGRSRACRPPNDGELGATMVIAIPITEASAKARTGPPIEDAAADRDLPYWYGVVPLVTTRGTPIPG